MNETLYEYAVRVRRMSGHQLMHEVHEIMHMIEDDPLPDWDLCREFEIVRNEIAIRN
jgi:hypothetical protein